MEFLHTRCSSRRPIDKRESTTCPNLLNKQSARASAETYHESEALQASESPKQSVGGMTSKGRVGIPNSWIAVSLVVSWVEAISAQGIKARAGFKSNLMVRGWRPARQQRVVPT